MEPTEPIEPPTEEENLVNLTDTEIRSLKVRNKIGALLTEVLKIVDNHGEDLSMTMTRVKSLPNSVTGEEDSYPQVKITVEVTH